MFKWQQKRWMDQGSGEGKVVVHWAGRSYHLECRWNWPRLPLVHFYRVVDCAWILLLLLLFMLIKYNDFDFYNKNAEYSQLTTLTYNIQHKQLILFNKWEIYCICIHTASNTLSLTTTQPSRLFLFRCRCISFYKFVDLIEIQDWNLGGIPFTCNNSQFN